MKFPFSGKKKPDPADDGPEVDIIIRENFFLDAEYEIKLSRWLQGWAVIRESKPEKFHA